MRGLGCCGKSSYYSDHIKIITSSSKQGTRCFHWLMSCCVLSIRPMHHLHDTKRLTAAVSAPRCCRRFLYAYMDGVPGSRLRNTGQEVSCNLPALSLHPYRSLTQEAFDTVGYRYRPRWWRDHHDTAYPLLIDTVSSQIMDSSVYWCLPIDVSSVNAQGGE